MRSKRELKKAFPALAELIESLWREYPGLYRELYKRETDPQKEDQPDDPWIKNRISDQISSALALGEDNLADGNHSVALGSGMITGAFREIALGSYGSANSDPLTMPGEWRELDRLISVGKGLDDSNRADALILFKSGLLTLFNAFQPGEYDHRDGNGDLVLPGEGVIQYTGEKSLELWRNGRWNPLGDAHYRHTQTLAARVWEIHHNLGKYPAITILDFQSNEYEAEVNHYDSATATVTFSQPFAGYADCN